MELAKLLGVSATTVVNQLKHLKIAGVVRYHSSGVRRAGRKVEYWLADRQLARVVGNLEKCLRGIRG
jgi:predicted transcriptional regulator